MTDERWKECKHHHHGCACREHEWEERAATLNAEIERLKARTWEAERAAIVAWLRDTIYDPARDRLAERVEAGEHWPGDHQW